MKMIKVQLNMVEFDLIVTKVELCVLNYFCEKGGGQCDCSLLQIVINCVGHSHYDVLFLRSEWRVY